MSRACVFPVNWTQQYYGKDTLVTHMACNHLNQPVHNKVTSPPTHAQPVENICTVLAQVFGLFLSVNERFVHIMHIAYKKNYYLEKGNY